WPGHAWSVWQGRGGKVRPRLRIDLDISSNWNWGIAIDSGIGEFDLQDLELASRNGQFDLRPLEIDLRNGELLLGNRQLGGSNPIPGSAYRLNANNATISIFACHVTSRPYSNQELV